MPSLPRHAASGACSSRTTKAAGLTGGILLFTAIMAFGNASFAATSGPEGIWLDHTKRGAIEIFKCGRSLCGRVVWMKKPLKPSGKPFRDLRNSDQSQRQRTICGMQMIGGLRKSGARTWSDGWIYDPERGQQFSLKLTQRGGDRLTVTGYLLSPAFGKSFAWTRAPKDVGRCAPVVKAATG